MKDQLDLFMWKSKEMIPLPQHSDSFYMALRPFLIFCRILGLIPIKGVSNSDSQFLQFRWMSVPTSYSVFICTCLTFSTIINFVVAFKERGETPADMAWSIVLGVFYGIGVFMYIFCMTRASRLLTLFKKWRQLFLHYEGVDKNLKRDVNIMAAMVLTSCICEHLYAHIKFFPVVETAEKRLLDRKDVVERLAKASAWEVYYWRSHPFIGDIIPYHWLIALAFFVMAKYSIISWNCGDVIVASMARALYYRFKLLNEQAELELIDKSSGIVSRDKQKWIQLARDHEKLCELTHEFDSILSPLILVGFGVNIYFFCLQLNLGLTPRANREIITTVYAIWSFLHLIGRIILVSVIASHVHTHAHGLEYLLEKCPIECFTAEVERAERRLRGTHIGLTGLRCFEITRKFILHLINVVFTLEIVLLQTNKP